MSAKPLTAVLAAIILLTCGPARTEAPEHKNMNQSVAFATYATDRDDLYWGLVMSESLREFGGSLTNAAVRIYIDDTAPELDTMFLQRRESLNVSIEHSHTPDGMKRIIYAQKAYAAALAERETAQTGEILAWLDPDVVFVKEPSAFRLDSNVALGYRPVQLLNISSRYNQPPDEFWSRLYRILNVADSSIFPMTTTTDLVEIRPQFNAGMLIVRPERGILRSWPPALEKLCADSAIQSIFSKDRRTAIFLHQAALAGAILATVPRDQMADLPSTYNYAFLFADRLPPEKRAASLDDVVMFRHDLAFADPAQRAKVSDSSKIFQWVKQRWPQ